MLKRIVLFSGMLMFPLGVWAASDTVEAPAKEVTYHSESLVNPEPKKLPEPEPEPKPEPVKEVEPKVEEKKEPQGTHIRMEVTGYTAGYESTQKKKGEPGYGITASGEYVEQGVTIAAGKQIPFGTKVYIPYFDNQPGFDDGIFIVEDRGGAIGPYNIDVYYDSLTDAQNFGRNVLDVYILED